MSSNPTTEAPKTGEYWWRKSGSLIKVTKVRSDKNIKDKGIGTEIDGMIFECDEGGTGGIVEGKSIPWADLSKKATLNEISNAKVKVTEKIAYF